MTMLTMPTQSKFMELMTCLEEASKRVDECDFLVVIMQKKNGGLIHFSPNERVATLSFVLHQFLHNLHSWMSE